MIGSGDVTSDTTHHVNLLGTSCSIISIECEVSKEEVMFESYDSIYVSLAMRISIPFNTLSYSYLQYIYMTRWNHRHLSSLYDHVYCVLQSGEFFLYCRDRRGSWNLVFTALILRGYFGRWEVRQT